MEGGLYLGMMWRSRKALDLLHDPRLVLHSTICSSTGSEVEISLTGLAVEVHEPSLRGRYVRAVAERSAWPESRFHLFAVDIHAAGMVTYSHGEQLVRLWPQHVEHRRPYP